MEVPSWSESESVGGIRVARRCRRIRRRESEGRIDLIATMTLANASESPLGKPLFVLFFELVVKILMWRKRAIKCGRDQRLSSMRKRGVWGFALTTFFFDERTPCRRLGTRSPSLSLNLFLRPQKLPHNTDPPNGQIASSMSHEGNDHAAELDASGAHDHATHAAHSHSLPPGVVALSGAELAEACALAASEDPRAALDLRVAAIFIIAVGSALGVFLPLLLQRWRAFDKNRAPFFVLKAFGAGVILATGVVHMYPAASSALASPCLGWPEFPW